MDRSSAITNPTNWHPLRAYLGVSGEDGRAISGQDHLRASIIDILTTPLGSRVMRRTYGCRLFGLSDAPFGPGMAAEIVASIAEALETWEPRIDLSRVVARADKAGRVVVDLTYRVNGTSQVLLDVAL